MQRFSHEQILDEIHKFFDWNPPLLSADLSVIPKLDVPPCFYYDHLDRSLSFKKTIIWPALVANLSTTVDRVLEDIKERKVTLPPVLRGDWFSSIDDLESDAYSEPITDAYSVSQAYQSTTSQHCALVASMLLLSPRSPKWRALIRWDEIGPGAKANPGLDEAHTLYMEGYLNKDGRIDSILDSVEGDKRSTLSRVIRHSPILALWEIFAVTPDNEELLKALGKPPAQIRRESTAITEELPPPIDLPYRPDAKILPWGTLMSSLSVELPLSDILTPSIAEGTEDLRRRSSRSQKRIANEKATIYPATRTSRSNGRSEGPTRTITLPNLTKPRDEPLSEVMLKYVWLRAVQKDSTFVIFHCGTYERIAFRHRESQTFYISDLIDVTHCTDPGYGKLHIGLYMSIMHDVLDRIGQQSTDGSGKSSKRRRHKENASGPKPKRPKTRALVAKLKADEIEHEKACDYLTSDATRCDLLVLKMCYGVYNSPSPSFFLRSGRSGSHKLDFQPHEHLSVTLTSDIAAGATGIVHGATLYFSSDEGAVRNMPVVVKFSMKRGQQKRLRHEYSIYEKLASSRVKGVPRVFGLFESQNRDILVLVMTHTGTCLSTIHRGRRFVVEEPQRSAFLHTISDIHGAGVRHRDIRPENLTVDDEGRVFFIDFDMAEISPTEGAKSRELDHLIELLDGRYLPPHEFPSERTNPRSSESRSGGGSGSTKSSPDSGSHSASSTEEE